MGYNYNYSYYPPSIPYEPKEGRALGFRGTGGFGVLGWSFRGPVP